MSADESAPGSRLRLTSPGRVVWPEAGFTKGELLTYYRRVAPVLLPHLVDRPVTLARFPEGVDRYGWYQTQCRGPSWIPRRRVGTQDYCLLNDLPSLLWAANGGAVELHPLLSRGERVEEPTAVVFDLDPGPPAGLRECCDVALALHDRLAEAGLASCVKTSGSLGLHVLVPLNAPATFAAAKAFARAVAAELAARLPDRVVWRTGRSLRTGKVLVDWGQNAAPRSLVAPYSLRAMHVPTVAAPLTWDEVERVSASHGSHGLVFTPAAVLERIERLGDPFRVVLELVQRLPVGD
ncbi:MAG: ATP-dependent DNA ligase [Thermoleophilia bacterium]|nr:ATP-dependent DNA ligase [Thermoleophilia bacterium]MDQ3857154.1 non-homologous end-joining DNA ligase [Actinomycetota bacterium]